MSALTLPYTSVTAAAGGSYYEERYHFSVLGVSVCCKSRYWGGGGGGVGLDGKSPYSRSNTGRGYGGGGGNYDRPGMGGVAVLFTGTGVVAGNDIPWG